MSIRLENFWDFERSVWEFIENFHENVMNNSFAMAFGQIALSRKNRLFKKCKYQQTNYIVF